MGWDSASNWNKKADVVADTLNDFRRSGWTIHDHASTSQGLYVSATTTQGETLLFCIMISKRGGELMRKNMSENMGPAMTDCPLRLLDLKSDYVNHEYASAWRQSVREYHAKKAEQNQKMKSCELMGKTIDLYGKRFKVFAKAGRSYRAVLLATGQTFKIGPKVALDAVVVS